MLGCFYLGGYLMVKPLLKIKFSITRKYRIIKKEGIFVVYPPLRLVIFAIRLHNFVVF